MRSSRYLALTAARIRTWELGASAIIEILKSSGPYNLENTVKVELSSFLGERGLDEGFGGPAEEDPWERMWTLTTNIPSAQSVLKATGILFRYLLSSFIPLNTAYGGIHLSAWNFEFPTRVESIIWRTACFIIMGGYFLGLIIPSLRIVYPDLRGSLPPRRGRAWRIPLQGAIFSFGWLYGASRLYLVVESFVSLRHVPIGVYAAVPWVQNIPHV